MAYEIPGMQITLEAAADLSAHQFKFVKLDANGRIAAIAAVTDKPIGILQDKPAALGRGGNVMLAGVSKVSADSALTQANSVGTSVDGQAAAYIHGTDTTKYIVGQVLIGTANAGEIATIAFSCLGIGRGA
jgi:hypothetical protein